MLTQRPDAPDERHDENDTTDDDEEEDGVEPLHSRHFTHVVDRRLLRIRPDARRKDEHAHDLKQDNIASKWDSSLTALLSLVSNPLTPIH